MVVDSATINAPPNGGVVRSKPNPPSIITLKGQHGDENNGDSEHNFGSAQTPKHANKTKDDMRGRSPEKQSNTPERGGTKRDQPERQPPSYRGEDGSEVSYGSYPPPRPYDSPSPGSGSAFQSHDSRRPPSMPSQSDQYGVPGGRHAQLSPNGGRRRHEPEYQRMIYYGGRSAPPDPYLMHHGGHPSMTDHRGYADFIPPMRSQQRNYDGSHPSLSRYPPGSFVPPPSSLAVYPPDVRGSVPSWGVRPPPYHVSHHPAYQAPMMLRDPYQRPTSSTLDPRYSHDNGAGDGTFSRTISSSFDRSVKSRASEGTRSKGIHKEPISRPQFREDHRHVQDASMASEDSSWRQLKQVHSVDENTLREQLEKHQKEDQAGKTKKPKKEPSSNSSSLTNSPTDDPERRRARNTAMKDASSAPPVPHHRHHQPSSLDSLSSIASAQEPIDTTKTNPKASHRRSDPHAPSSPGNDSSSLDLMKCSSGSSGLLHLPTQSDNFSFDNKRLRDEERGDVDTSDVNGQPDIRRALSDVKGDGNLPPSKRARMLLNKGRGMKEENNGETEMDELNDDKRESPESHEALKPPKPTMARSQSLGQGASKTGASPPSEGSYFDKPPAFSYSLESAPSFPKDSVSQLKQPAYPTLPPRPGSSSSSTITPMGGNHAMNLDHRDAHDNQVGGVVSSIASWEIHAQDSFGGGSVGNQGLASSFSFQDYPMLSTADSGLGYNPVADVAHPPGMHGHLGSHGMSGLQHSSNFSAIESRNSPFESGHFYPSQAGYHRATDSMDISYSGRSLQDRHQGQFPPHAPSWGTNGSGSAGSSSHPSMYGSGISGFGVRGPAFNHPAVTRNFSEESTQRTSPPLSYNGAPPHRGIPGGRLPNAFTPQSMPPQFASLAGIPQPPPEAVYIMQQPDGPLTMKHLPPKGSLKGDDSRGWRKEDDERLAEIMKGHKNPRNWEPIAAEMGDNRTAKECHDRWSRHLKPGVRKGQWTDEEDTIVMDAVSNSTEQPFTRWSDLAQRLPGRVGKQIRDRWVNHLNPNINHLPFSREDDLLLWKGHQQLGKRWVEISTKLFDSSRSENHIKNRWYSASFKKFIANEFGPNAYSGGSKASSSTSSSKKDKKKRSPKKSAAAEPDDDDGSYRP